MEQPMMPNGMPGQVPQMASMQRPQPGNFRQQIFARIINDLKSTMGQFNGTWQATLDPRIRANLILQLTTTLSLLEPELLKCLHIAQRFEQNSIASAQNRNQYEQSINAKLEEIKVKRTQKANVPRPGPDGLQQQQQQQAMAGGAPSAQDAGIMLQQLQQQQGNTNPAMHQGFPAQLQRPMQPSMLQPQAQRPATMDPSFLMNRQTVNPQIAMGMNLGNNNNNSNNAGTAVDMGQANGQQQQQQQDNSIEVQQLAQQYMAQMPESKKNELRKQLFAQMTEQQRSNYNARGGDPLKIFVISKARQEVAKKKGLQQGPGLQMLNNDQRQQFDQVNAASLGLDQQGGNNFSLSQLYGQQANALKLQESGEQVVPVSDNNMFGNAAMKGNNQNATINMLGHGQKASAEAHQRQMLLQRQQQQANKQLQDRLVNQRNDLARAQAMNAQQQAGGQAMGMSSSQLGMPNTMNGQLNSPAMNLLTRPMQATNSQQGFTNHAVQNFNTMAGPDANALAQHHVNMVNQNNTANLPQGPPQAMRDDQLTALLDSLPVETRNKILSLPPLERNMTLHRFKMVQDAKLAAQQGRRVQPPLSAGQDTPGIGGNAQPNLMNMLPQQQLQPQQQPGGMPTNGQPTPDQLRQRQQHIIRSQAMLSRPLPRHIANQLQIPVPPNVQKWNQLRQHIHSNQTALPPDMMNRMMQAMERHFATNPADLQQGVKEVLAMHQQSAQRSNMVSGMAAASAAPQSMLNPNVGSQFGGQPAIAGQMGAPVAPMQAAPHMDIAGPPPNFLPQISAQEIAQIRMLRKIGPHISDGQIRQAMLQRKMAGMAQSQASQAISAPSNIPQQQQQGNGINNNAPRPMPGSKRPAVQPPAAPNNAASKLAQQQVRRAPSASDDVVEIPNPNAAKKSTPAATAQQKMAPQISMPTPEQLAKLPEEQRRQIQQQFANMQRASQGAAAGQSSPSVQQMAQSEAQRIHSLKQQHKMTLNKLYSEIGALPPKAPPVKVEAAQVNEVRMLFKRMWKPLQALEQTLPTAYKVVPGFSDEQAKQLLKAKHLFDQNLADEEGNIKGYLSANLMTFKQISHLVMQHYADIQKHSPKRGDALGQPGIATSQPSAPARPSMSQQGSGAASMVGRSSSKAGSKPPSAPVDDKKFWGGIASPHGVPKYDTQKPDLTADQLKMPPGKKRKTGPATSQPTTPAQPVTPSATPKLPSGKVDTAPRTAVAGRPAQPETEKARFRCPHAESCDASIIGFETEMQLKAHMESAHPAIDDPYEFLMNATAEIIKAVPAAKPKTATTAKGKPQATTMAKLPSKQSIKSTPGKALAAASDAVSTKPVVAAGDVDMQTTMMQKLGFTPQPASKDDTATDVDDNNNFMAGLGDILKADLEDDDILGNSATMQIDDWGMDMLEMTSPELTPGTGSDSSRDSDVSFNDQMRINLSWDAFGTGETQLPAFLRFDDELAASAKSLAADASTATQALSNDTGGINKEGSKDSANRKDAGKAVDTTTAANKTSTEDWIWTNDEIDWEEVLKSSTKATDPTLTWDEAMAL